MQIRFGAQYGLVYDPIIPKPLVEQLNKTMAGVISQSPSHRHVMDNTSDTIRIVVKPLDFPKTRNFKETPFNGDDQLDITVETNDTFSHYKASNDAATPEPKQLALGLSTRTMGVYQSPQYHQYLTVNTLTSAALEGQQLLQATVNQLMGNILLVDAAYKAVAHVADKVFQKPSPPNPEVKPLA